MNLLISLIVILYLIGVGVVLSPVVESNWSSASASGLVTSVGQALPEALAWPVRFYHRVADRR
ncbi:hypothetical protein DFR50_10940 [Roseiarcus fermentans]|uniref:Uncharacterized protein n=1 Tax=Roseiarcus fermentans TaxID=1473586 RepID=A0A366FI64_9HYPH|nr:hypothetical protein [Roseiarcus fermentans]RBP14287.1 hypothetical protein DFR50_10940 [Roseiarcus fermentans]